MKNQVIKVLNKEHGSNVIKYWQSIGIDINPLNYKGKITLEDYGEYSAIYYGVISGIFANYGIEEVNKTRTEIIQLPEDPFKELKRAHSQGEIIQFKTIYNSKWIDTLFNKPQWDVSKQYRVKPKKKWNPKHGDRVNINSGATISVNRIYLCTIEGADTPYITVHEDDETCFRKGDKFRIQVWRNIKEYKPTFKVSKQDIAEWKGIEVEQVEIV